jgi:hypothetical protein
MAKWGFPNDTLEDLDLSEVTRVEVIDPTGRAYVALDIEEVELSLQDDYKTLKIFIKK